MIKAFIVGRNISCINNMKFELLRSGGCGKFSANIFAGSEKPLRGDIVKIYQDADTIYSATIENIEGTPETGYQLSGINTTLYDTYIEDGLVIPSLTEKQSWLMLKSLLGSLGLSIYDMSMPELAMSTSNLLTEVDVGGKSVFDALNEFALKSETPLAWGVDGRNRLYVYPVSESLNGLQHLALRSTKRYTYQLNGMLSHGSIYFVSNSEQRFPPLHENAAFQRMVSHPSDVMFSELNLFSSQQTNGKYNSSLGSGEDGDPKFTRNAGANIATLPGGQKAYDIDHVGEYIELTNAFRYFALKTGMRYCLRYLVAGEVDTVASPIDVTVTVTWTGIIGAIQQIISVSNLALEEKRFYFTAPVGATGATIRFEKTAGPNSDTLGANIRDITLFRDDRAYPEGWSVVIPTAGAGTSQVIDYGMVEGSNFYINNQLPMVVDSTNWVGLRRFEASEVKPGVLMKWILAIKAAPSVAWPKSQVVVEFFKEDGTTLTPYSSPVIDIATPYAMAIVSNMFSVPLDAKTALMSLRFLTLGGATIGGLVARDARETSTTFYGDVVAVQRSFGAGRQIKIEGEARDIAEADAYITAWRATQTDEIESPEIAVDIPSLPYAFEKPMRIVEDNRKHPLESVEYDLAKMECTLALSSKPKTLEDLIARNKKTASGL